MSSGIPRDASAHFPYGFLNVRLLGVAAAELVTKKRGDGVDRNLIGGEFQSNRTHEGALPGLGSHVGRADDRSHR